MPPRLPPSTRALWRSEPYVCQSCLLKAASQRSRQTAITQHRVRRGSEAYDRWSTKRIRVTSDAKRPTLSVLTKVRGGRHASHGSVASTTAVNAPSSVPPNLRELHQRLLALQDKASSYVDLSRLQLAARSLESSEPVIRVALLGLGSNGALAARKLARVLLSDALSDEQAWEEGIIASASDGRGSLLRFGDAEEATQSHPLVQPMNIPSPFLLRHNIELLVTTLNTNQNAPNPDREASLSETILVPSLTTPSSSGGRVGFVRYPVHKAVVVAEGIAGAVEYGRLPTELFENSAISSAVSLPLRPSTGVKAAEQEATGNTVDIDLAQHALDLFRASKANGAEFSNEWQTSRAGAMSEWIAGPKHTDASSNLNPVVHDLVSAVLLTASSSVSASQSTASATAAAATVPEPKRTAFQAAISDWSADAHRDLQLNLDTAFTTSPSWRRTSWWRLFWRIDDVTVSASEVLRRSWLTEAEQRLAFLSGRVLEAGLSTEDRLRASAPRLLDEGRQAEMVEYEIEKDRTETVAELMQMPSMLSRMQQQSGLNALFNPPWPQTINLSRQYMLHTLVPELYGKAQALLVTTMTTIGGSAALGAWFFVATRGLGLYESGAIFALGLVWGIRRLQKRWTKEREEFASTVREDARRVLGEVEAHLRKLVSEGGKVSVRPEDEHSWREAREAVESCREALEKTDSGK